MTARTIAPRHFLYLDATLPGAYHDGIVGWSIDIVERDMIALVVTFAVDEAKTAEFEAIIAGLTQATLAGEPGAKMYQLCRSAGQPIDYRLLELYEDQAALDHHMQSEWFKAGGKKLAGVLTGRPKIEQFETV